MHPDLAHYLELAHAPRNRDGAKPTVLAHLVDSAHADGAQRLKDLPVVSIREATDSATRGLRGIWIRTPSTRRRDAKDLIEDRKLIYVPTIRRVERRSRRFTIALPSRSSHSTCSGSSR